MEKETLEEVALRLYPIDIDDHDDHSMVEYDCNLPERIAFIEGTKRQAERMYSEEDLRKAFHVGGLYLGREGDVNFEKWFEQFKKK